MRKIEPIPLRNGFRYRSPGSLSSQTRSAGQRRAFNPCQANGQLINPDTFPRLALPQLFEIIITFSIKFKFPDNNLARFEVLIIK